MALTTLPCATALACDHDDVQDAPSLLQSEGASRGPVWQLADELFDA
jgi:hypothetical protein